MKKLKKTLSSQHFEAFSYQILVTRKNLNVRCGSRTEGWEAVVKMYCKKKRIKWVKEGYWLIDYFFFSQGDSVTLKQKKENT